MGRNMTASYAAGDYVMKNSLVWEVTNRVKEFQIEVKEELSRVETIKAETLGEAIDKAMELYYGQNIILGAEDMKGVDFLPMQQEKSR
jgi:L-lactate utilization protein LutC